MHRLTIDLNNPPKISPERLAAIDALTPEEIEENARNDPDNPPMTDDELRRLRLARRVQQIRASRGMPQSEFAQLYALLQRCLKIGSGGVPSRTLWPWLTWRQSATSLKPSRGLCRISGMPPDRASIPSAIGPECGGPLL